LPVDNGREENIATAVTEVSDRMTLLVREEIELAKAEVTEQVTALARGAAAVAAGAVFGVFAVVFLLLTLAWGLNSLIGSIWLGFLIVLILLLLMTAGAFLFARKKLQGGAPVPQMAIDEAKKIRASVKTEVHP
jgi:sensor histidine kinase regulating citrate/malate metabolism